MKITIADHSPSFAEDKDVAANIRKSQIIPALGRSESVTIDFKSIDLATQSFIHALISMAIRNFPDTFFELVTFKNANSIVRSVISTVCTYTQESMDQEDA